MGDSEPNRLEDSQRLIQFSFPTDLTRVGDAVEEIASCCLLAGAATQRVRFRLCTVVAEALTNAMFYGNRNNPKLRVLVVLTLEPDRMVVTVIDEGEGFDPAAVPHPFQLSSESQSGRGLFLIQHFADEVSFNRRGNAITMTLLRV